MVHYPIRLKLKQQQQNELISLSDALLEQKISRAIEGLPFECYNCLAKRVTNKKNIVSICDYIASMKAEVNPAISYRKSVIVLLTRILEFFNNSIKFKDLTRENVLSFLDSFRKSEESDPLHKWIGTYNIFRMHLMRFFRWLHYPDVENRKRPKPPVVENIPKLKRKEKSIYKPTDLWTQEEEALFLKYCPSARDRFAKSISRDTAARPCEWLGLRIKDVVIKITPDKKQYAEVTLPSAKTGPRTLPLINSLPYYKEWLSHHHPTPGNPNSILICGFGKSPGRKITERSYNRVFQNYEAKYFPKLLEDTKVPPEDKQKIRELLKKPWNLYIQRHTGLTEKSRMLKTQPYKQFAGWTPNSLQHMRYEHYFGNESSESLLQEYGILPKDNQSINILKAKTCSNCDEPNRSDAKFCAKCRMVLTYDAYNETLESEKQKGDRLTAIETDFNSMKAQMQLLITTLNGMNQPEKNVLAKRLVNAGIFKSAKNS